MQLAVQQELDAVLGRLEKGLAADVYERVLQLIATEGDDAPTPTPEGTLERFRDPWARCLRSRRLGCCLRSPNPASPGPTAPKLSTRNP
jgi:hypothetical protein